MQPDLFSKVRALAAASGTTSVAETVKINSAVAVALANGDSCCGGRFGSRARSETLR